MPNPAYADGLALAYLHAHDFFTERVDGRVLVSGAWVKVLYSTTRMYRGYYRWALPRPLVCDVLMLITDDDGDLRFFLFDPDDAVFYYADGSLKRAITWYPGRAVQRFHNERYDALVDFDMQTAHDRIELVEAARIEYSGQG